MTNSWSTPKGMKEYLTYYGVRFDEVKRCDKYQNAFTAKRILKPGYDVLFPASVYEDKIKDHLCGARIIDASERKDSLTCYRIITITFQFPSDESKK